MTPRRPSRSTGIMILGASFGGSSRAVADALQRYIKSRESGSFEVRVVDLFEETMPGLNVLARFAHQQDPDFFPAGFGTWSDLATQYAGNPVMTEIERGGMDRFLQLLDAARPDAIISCVPLGTWMSAHVAEGRSILTAGVASGFSVRDTAIHPDTDLHFVANRESRDELVVAGVPYDRIVVAGVPVSGMAAVPVGSGPGVGFRAVIDGSGPGGAVARVAGALSAAGVRVVTSPVSDDRARKAIGGLIARGGSILEAVTTTEALAALGNGAVAVVHGGSSFVQEAIAAGCPVIIYNEAPALELHGLDFLVNAGAAFMARDEADAVEKARFLSGHPGRLLQMAKVAAELAKPAAAQTVCERVIAGL